MSVNLAAASPTLAGGLELPCDDMRSWHGSEMATSSRL